VQVEEMGRVRLWAVRADGVDHQEVGGLRHGLTASPQNGAGMFVVPIQEDSGEDVSVSSGRQAGEEVAADDVASIADSRRSGVAIPAQPGPR
jgi:hypothetical protein